MSEENFDLIMVVAAFVVSGMLIAAAAYFAGDKPDSDEEGEL